MQSSHLSIFAASFLSVLRVFLVCAAGTWLARRGILKPEFRRELSRIILLLMLPCLLASKLSANANFQNLLAWGVLPLTALVYVGLGMFLGRATVRVLRVPGRLNRVVTAASAFGNSGYIPFPLVMAVEATAPMFRDDPGAADRGIAYISVYLVGLSPMLWGIGFPYLSGKPLGHFRVKQVFSPPVCSVLAGIALGVIPPLRALFVASHAPFRVVMDTAELIGMGAIPCALLILGANLADAPTEAEGINHRPVAAVCLARLVVLPVCGIFITLGLLHLDLIPRDPMCLLVLMIEASVPPATNLIVMCQVHKRGEAAMSKILVWTYIASVGTLTVFVALFQWILGNI